MQNVFEKEIISYVSVAAAWNYWYLQQLPKKFTDISRTILVIFSFNLSLTSIQVSWEFQKQHYGKFIVQASIKID